MNAVHAHLILNHLPPAAVAFGVALLAWALWKADVSLRKAGLAALLLGGLAAPLVFWTGSGAEEILERLPGWEAGLIERHEEAAEVATWACVLLAATAFWALRAPAQVWERRTRVVLAAALACLALLSWAAWRGGQIRHSEIEVNWSPAADGRIVAPLPA